MPTKAELEATIQQLQAQLDATKRRFYRGALFPNQNRREGHEDPPWQGNIRLPMACSECGHRHPVWFDLNLFEADPDRYDSDTKPEFNISMSPMRAEYATKREVAHQAYIIKSRS